MADWRDRHSVVPAVYIIFRDGNKILLAERANTGYRDGEYSLPAGHLDGGESAVKAAVREAKEEVGVTIEPEDLQLVHTQHRVADSGDHERINLFFETTKWSGELTNAEAHKCAEIRWFELDTLPKNLVIELQHMLLQFKKHQPYGDFGFEE